MATKKSTKPSSLKTVYDVFKRYNNRKISVLGTKYTIYLRTAEKDKELQRNNPPCGYIYADSHYIVVNYDKLKDKAEDNFSDCLSGLYATLRHELVHAFLAESGLDWDSIVVDSGWAVNEEMVDWISKQTEKIHKAYVELGITGE